MGKKKSKTMLPFSSLVIAKKRWRRETPACRWNSRSKGIRGRKSRNTFPSGERKRKSNQALPRSCRPTDQKKRRKRELYLSPSGGKREKKGDKRGFEFPDVKTANKGGGRGPLPYTRSCPERKKIEMDGKGSVSTSRCSGGRERSGGEDEGGN